MSEEADNKNKFYIFSKNNLTIFNNDYNKDILETKKRLEYLMCDQNKSLRALSKTEFVPRQHWYYLN